MSFADEFFHILSEPAHEKKGANVTAARVVAVNNGRAVLQFDEDSEPSQKIYRALASFVPVVGRRVMLVNNVIIGSIV